MCKRCDWAGNDPLYISYHDNEWGVPVHDDRRWFEFITLDGAQAGLSWITILRKRENYRKALDDFNVIKIAQYDSAKIEELMSNSGIVRNRRKIESVISNAQAFIGVQKEFGSFDKYIWSFVGGKPIINSWVIQSQVPATSQLSDALSKDLSNRGFKFIGSTICYAIMQAAGIVNDHLVSCFRYTEINEELYSCIELNKKL